VRCTAPQVRSSPGLPGYRCPAGSPHNWTAVFVPRLNQVWTNPRSAASEARHALPEEFFHLITVSLRPAQLYPILNYLAGEPRLPDVEQFGDIVEAIYAASWPLLRNKPLLARNLPATSEDNRQLCLQVLRMARFLAQFHARPSDSPTGQRSALWALMMFFHYVVPRTSGQAVEVMRLLSTFPPPHRWATRMQLLRHLTRQAARALASAQRAKNAFYLSNSDDVHVQTRHALLLASLILRTQPSHLMPAIPALLGVMTLRTSTFVPVFYLRDTRRFVHASMEIWDITPHLRRLQKSLLLNPPLGQGVPPWGSCPTATFYWDHIARMVSHTALSKAVIPSAVFVEALTQIAAGVRTLAPHLLRGLTPRCLGCQKMRDANVVHAMASIDRLFPRRLVHVLNAARGYPQWLCGSGVHVIETELRKAISLNKPIRLDAPHEVRDEISWPRHLKRMW
jgi:hypothetical protein